MSHKVSYLHYRQVAANMTWAYRPRSRHPPPGTLKSQCPTQSPSENFRSRTRLVYSWHLPPYYPLNNWLRVRKSINLHRCHDDDCLFTIGADLVDERYRFSVGMHEFKRLANLTISKRIILLSKWWWNCLFQCALKNWKTSTKVVVVESATSRLDFFLTPWTWKRQRRLDVSIVVSQNRLRQSVATMHRYGLLAAFSAHYNIVIRT